MVRVQLVSSAGPPLPNSIEVSVPPPHCLRRCSVPWSVRRAHPRPCRRSVLPPAAWSGRSAGGVLADRRLAAQQRTEDRALRPAEQATPMIMATVHVAAGPLPLCGRRYRRWSSFPISSGGPAAPGVRRLLVAVVKVNRFQPAPQPAARRAWRAGGARSPGLGAV